MELELREANYTLLQGRLKAWVRVKPFELSAWNMYNGDHWDRGYGYIGPMPAIDDKDSDRVLDLISRAFTSRNVVRETVDRAIDGLISRSPNWKVFNQEQLLSRAIQEAQQRADNSKRLQAAEKSTEAVANAPEPKFVPRAVNKDTAPNIKATAVDGNIKLNVQNDQGSQDVPETVNKKEIEAEILLGKLWTDLNLKSVLEASFAERLVTGRGCVRVYVPKKYQNDDGSLKNISGLLEATKAVRAEHIERERAKVIDDEGHKMSVVRLEKSTKGTAKITTLKGIEISFVDDDDLTYLAVFEPSNQAQGKKNITPPENLNDEENTDVPTMVDELRKKADVSSGIFLDGNLLTEEVSGVPFVTSQLLQNNRALNLDLTLGVNVLVEDGFTEMITTNASIEYVEVADLNNPGKMKKVAKTLQRGSSMVTNLVGVQSFDEKGNKTYQTPGAQFRTPTTLSTFSEGENLYYKQCLAETKQIFVLISADSLASGESRIQARQDFLNEILRFKADIDKLGGWLLSTLLHLTATLAGQDGYFKGIGVNFDSRVTAGDLSADEKNVVITRYDKHLISRENAMVLLGSEDPLLEVDAIRADVAEQMDDNIRRVSAMSKFSQVIQADKVANPSTAPQDKKVKKGRPGN